jgi:hypothetical protein
MSDQAEPKRLAAMGQDAEDNKLQDIKEKNAESAGNNEANAEQSASDEVEEKRKTSKLKKLWDAIGMDMGIFLMMVKGSLPPTIAVAW